MTQEKTQRNKLILELRGKGLAYQQIFEELEKRGYTGLATPDSVKMQYSRLVSSKKITRKPEKKVAVKPEKKKPRKPAKQIPSKPESQKRIKVTFQIPEKLFIQIKIKAVREHRRISDLVGEIFNQYLGGS